MGRFGGRRSSVGSGAGDGGPARKKGSDGERHGHRHHRSRSGHSGGTDSQSKQSPRAKRLETLGKGPLF